MTRDTLITVMHENNKHKRTIATWECLERLSASIECLRLDQEQHDIFLQVVKDTIMTIESASFTKGKAVAEREYNQDLRSLVKRLDVSDGDDIITERLELNEQ